MAISRKRFETQVGNRTLSVELSSLAPQTNASLLARYGDTIALVTVVMGKTDAQTDYLPLKVDYEERFYAAGKIIGSRFVRREGRPSEDAVLSGRLVDRTIRPLFDHALRREIQVVMTILQIDEENDPEFVGLIGSSLALAISDIPWQGPVGGIRIAKIGEEFKVNPPSAEVLGENCVFETFASGPKGKINMIELGGREASEQDVLRAFELAQAEIDKLIDFQTEVAAQIGKPKASIAPAPIDPELIAQVNSFLSPRLSEAIYQKDRAEHDAKLAELAGDLDLHLKQTYAAAPDPSGTPRTLDPKIIANLFEQAIDQAVHQGILNEEKRPDGRGLDEVRELNAEVGLFDRTHGSGLFVRGTTQALAITTLAAPGQEQLIETMEATGKRRFMLHYNFPPYSTGEVGRFGSPGRREIGHGALARKALESMIPSQEAFPYTIRVVSEVLSSNGSSSMATTCAATLSLMDAGVPIKAPVAGIAMGLATDNKNFKVLTDIQGPEDHYGDMDFKVAGTKDGITAIQLDTKVDGITPDIIRETITRAKTARLKILEVLTQAISAPRPAISKYAPAVLQLAISPDKIGLLIGPGGKTINGLIEKYGLATIDVEEDGRVFIASQDQAKAAAAMEEISLLTREVNVGDIVEGKIVKIMEFGAIVDLGGGQDGMIHVSELRDGFTKSVTDVVKEGDFVRAKVIRVENGKIGLSLKQLDS